MSNSGRIDRLKLRFSRPEGKISRRDLFKIVVPHYEAVPFVESAICKPNQECSICRDSCGLKAIKAEGGEAVIDTALCSGCGACVTACPHRAIIYPDFSPERLDEEMARLLVSASSLSEPAILALTCQTCLPVAGDKRTKPFTYSVGVMPLKLPCLAMASPWLMLRAFDRGSQGLALIYSRGKCPIGAVSSQWQQNIRFVKELLGYLDIEPERIRVFDVGNEPPKTTSDLEQFSREIAGFSPTSLKGSVPTAVPDKDLMLPALIKGLGRKLGGLPDRVATARAIPFGKIHLDISQCTACDLCKLHCPTGALAVSASEANDGHQLLFHHDRCIACGRCLDVCPEKCLRLEHILELDKLDSLPVVLFEDIVAKCRQCGSPIGSRAMINKLQSKLQAKGQPVTAQFELCLKCKVSRFSLGKTMPESSENGNNGHSA
ncbi:MAG: 4Fe-4S binding protein [Chloroflexi bacterium]|nr:4Fe-4S binding protein [Chloroflexota bacterium]